jgi:hypothetical protein
VAVAARLIKFDGLNEVPAKSRKNPEKIQKTLLLLGFALLNANLQKPYFQPRRATTNFIGRQSPLPQLRET